MKSRKLKAIFAALSAVAVMATAMTGFAAATTTYDLANNKVVVSETVRTAEAGKEVTYLVKSNDNIVYIDQATADNTGSATFNYKIAVDKLDVNLSTLATFGTDGDTPITDGSDVLPLAKFGDDNAETYTVEFTKAITGSEDTANATIVAKDGYEITAVKINGEAQVDFVGTVELKIGDVLVVETQPQQTDVVINDSAKYVEFDDANDAYLATCVITFTGDKSEAIGKIGMIYENHFYPALAAEGGKAAVQLKLPEKIGTVTEDDFYAEIDN